jgi:hypothetical protein
LWKNKSRIFFNFWEHRMNIRIAIFLLATLSLLKNFSFAADLSLKYPQKLITFQEQMGESEPERQNEKLLKLLSTDPLLAQAYADVVKTTKKWLLKHQEKHPKQGEFLFTISPRGYPIGRMREYDPKLEEEVLRLHQDPKRCYEMGLEFLKNADRVPSHLETAKVWFQRAADQDYDLAKTKLQTLNGN